MLSEKPTIVVDFELFVPTLHTIEVFFEIIHAEEYYKDEKEFRKNADELALTEEEAKCLDELIKEINTPSTGLYI